MCQNFLFYLDEVKRKKKKKKSTRLERDDCNPAAVYASYKIPRRTMSGDNSEFSRTRDWHRYMYIDNCGAIKLEFLNGSLIHRSMSLRNWDQTAQENTLI